MKFRTLGPAIGRRVVLSVAVAVLAISAGCTKPAAPAPSQTSQVPAFPVTIGSLTLAQRPERIVSLSATATEMLFAIDAGSQVVAVDTNSNYPPQVPKSDLSAYKPNAEAIANLHPDLVVISDDIDKIAAQLARLHIATLQEPSAKDIDATYYQLLELGHATGHTDSAQKVVDQMRSAIAETLKGLPQQPFSYYYELDQNYYSVTSKTFMGSVLALAGLKNIADTGNPDVAYPQLSAETIVKADPDLILLADTKCCGQTADTVGKRPGWSGLAAVKNGRVVLLDDDIASRWGPRIVDLLRAVVQAIKAKS